MKRRIVLIVGALFSLTAWGVEHTVNDASAIEADRVHITGNTVAGTAKDNHDVFDAAAIQSLYGFAVAPAHKWEPRTGEAPLLRWQVQFYRNDKLIFEYGVGDGFIENGKAVSQLNVREMERVSALIRTR